MDSALTDDISFHLSSEGPLRGILSGFRERPQQQRMARAVADTLDDRGALVVEAGTGTGKTLAYLIPAVLSGLRVIVSTGTRNLQEQLYFSDIPVVRRALGIEVSAAMLKGRANYLCPHRLALNLSGGREHGREFYHQLVLVREWASRTESGDIAEVTEIGESSPVWPSVTSTVDNCLGQDCPKLAECPLYRARARANDAELVVVNHHLLFADLLLKEEGFGQVLPAADAVILDEAHQLPEIATRFFGVSLGSRQLVELARDATREQSLVGQDDSELLGTAARYEESCERLLSLLGTVRPARRWREVLASPGVAESIHSTATLLAQLTDRLEAVAERSKGIESCHQRAVRLREIFGSLAQEEGARPEFVHWLESGQRHYTIHLSPLRVADQFNAILREKECAWVFTSATLAVGERFDYFVETMGLDESTQLLRLDSPFDFHRQALFYIPEDLPDPASPSFTATAVASALPVIEMCGGRTFFLFTSHRALKEARAILADNPRLNCFAQGTMPRMELLRRFLTTDNAVLLATSSFWEGVDVRGADLSCVIIDKLPFLSPGDPVVAARCEAMDRDGRGGFNHYLLPLAAISLRQGFGRLIRDETDYGVFMLADKRILTRSYGAQLVASLPEMALTRRLEVVRHFVQSSVPGREAIS